jgi:hypothetical protein
MTQQRGHRRPPPISSGVLSGLSGAQNRVPEALAGNIGGDTQAAPSRQRSVSLLAGDDSTVSIPPLDGHLV